MGLESPRTDPSIYRPIDKGKIVVNDGVEIRFCHWIIGC